MIFKDWCAVFLNGTFVDELLLYKIELNEKQQE